MKKKLLLTLLWGILTLFLLSSCRTEGSYFQEEQQKDMRFSVFVPKKEGETINYANGFAFLMKRYDSLHKTNLSGINNKPVIGTHTASTRNASILRNGEAYVEFNIRSQTLTEKNGDKWVVFPKVENNKVTALIIATLKENETQIVFALLDHETAFYKDIQPRFQQALDRQLSKANKRLNTVALVNSNTMALGDPPVREQEIEEVTVPGKPKDKDSEMLAPIIIISHCINIVGCYVDPGQSGGGGGAPSPSKPNTKNPDPCSKMKNKVVTEKGRNAIKDLEAKVKIPGNNETAYRQDKNGNHTQYEGKSDRVDLPIDSSIEGVYHNHPPGGVDMLSVKDIRMLLFAARMQSDDSVGNAFVGMISNSGNYFISFNGTKADIPVIYDSQVQGFREDYDRIQYGMSVYLKKDEQLSDKQLQKLFFDITDKMGLKGKVNLIKEKDGNTSTITQNPDGTVADPKPC